MVMNLKIVIIRMITTIMKPSREREILRQPKTEMKTMLEDLPEPGENQKDMDKLYRQILLSITTNIRIKQYNEPLNLQTLK